MEKASNLNLAADQAFVASTLTTSANFALEALTTANLLHIKGGGCGLTLTGDKRRRRTGG